MTIKQNRIYQGDCISRLDQLDPGTVDLVFADPPFNIGYQYDVYDDKQTTEDYLSWCNQWINGVYRALKSDGTFWLAIGDEYAAELKIAAQQVGFHCRSWVIWYYTFGVNCSNGFSRSHTHLFHFVKNKKQFTFNRIHPRIRVPSARQLVYADNRANPNGRLPDNTWITRPQDAPQFLSFDPGHDTWYFARVAGTFKEREGFHGCQMPEQLLARIIRTSSRPQESVLDPFCGSGTTVAVAKKLGRQWMGFELSEDYVAYINDRLERVSVGDPIDGPDDPVKSAPSTANGKRKKNAFDARTENVVIAAYKAAKYPADYILCNKQLNQQFVSACLEERIGGNAYIWNRYLLSLRKAGKLPTSSKKPDRLSTTRLNQFGFASEVAWRLLAIDYEKTLDDILCSPEFAAEFDRLSREFGPVGVEVSDTEFRLAALAIRKRAHKARTTAAEKFGDWMNKRRKLSKLKVTENWNVLQQPGVFVLCSDDKPFFVVEADNMKQWLETTMENKNWRELEIDSIKYLISKNRSSSERSALKSALVTRERPPLNCRLFAEESELVKN